MSEQTDGELAHMSVSQLQRLNHRCNDFERCWQSAPPPPQIEAALSNCPEEDRESLLRLLIPLDIAYRRNTGDTPQPTDYLPRFRTVDADWLARVHSDQTLHTLVSPPDRATPIKPTIPAGTRIGSYEVREQIGSGGMADVYRARHLLLQRDVALKLLRDSGEQGAKLANRFQKEMVIIARLSHPHVVTAFDAGEHDHRAYLITEYVDGTDLSRMVKAGGPFSIRKAVDCIRQAALGLDYAHRQGIIHRDVKPSNLLIDSNGVVKVSDLGLAGFSQRQSDDGDFQSDQTATDLVMGTVDYMAPEQAQSAKRADARSDLYSLGCSLFFLLTARPLFSGETLINRLDAHRHEPPPRLRDVRPDVPDELDAVFSRMVTKQPAERFQSMSDLLQALATRGDHAVQQSDGDGSFALSNETPFPGMRNDSPTLPATTAVNRNDKRESTTAHRERRRWIVAASLSAALLAVIGIAAAIISSFGNDLDPDEESAPPKLVVPFTLPGQRQQDWAKHYGVNVKRSDPLAGGVTIDFVFIPPGRFRMGSTPQQIAAMQRMQFEAFDVDLEIASPEMATIDQPFYLSTTEVTVGMFRQFVESSQPRYQTTAERDHRADGEQRGGYGLVEKVFDGRSVRQWEQRAEYYWDNLGLHPRGDNFPVVGVSWDDAQAFCKWLTRRAQANGENVIYRLPTEAEWEFAARAGADSVWFFGNDPDALKDYAVHNRFDGSMEFRPVASKQPNPFGLYDIYGNQAEWCLGLGYPDGTGTVRRAAQVEINRPPSDRYRPQRGGGALTPQSDCRSASVRFRQEFSPYHGAFRIVREIPAKKQ